MPTVADATFRSGPAGGETQPLEHLRVGLRMGGIRRPFGLKDDRPDDLASVRLFPHRGWEQ
jgi:hypothetical protein